MSNTQANAGQLARAALHLTFSQDFTFCAESKQHPAIEKPTVQHVDHLDAAALGVRHRRELAAPVRGRVVAGLHHSATTTPNNVQNQIKSPIRIHDEAIFYF